MRYLSELPWAPQAMSANGELEWRSAADGVVEVATRVAKATVAVRLEFDASGDIVGTSANRPRLERGEAVERPWSGTFSDYAVVGGARIPTSAEVRYDLPEGPFTYWRGTMSSFDAD